MTEQQAKIIEKIRRLLALSKSPNEFEAAAAAAKAQDLLFKYNLSTADIDIAGKSEEEYGAAWFNDGVNSRWRHMLLEAVASNSFCEAGRVIGRHGTYQILGKKSDIEIVTYLFNYLAETVERMAAQYRGKGLGREWLNAYRRGLVIGIAVTLRGQRLKSEREAGETSRALVISNIQKLEELKERFWAMQHSKPHPEITERAAFYQGTRDGRQIPIHQALKEEGAS